MDTNSKVLSITTIVLANTLASSLLAGFLVGCDSDKSAVRHIRKEVSDLPFYALSLAKTEEKPFTLLPESNSYTNLFMHIREVADPSVRSNLLLACEEAILDFHLDNRAYLSRLRSLQVFLGMTFDYAMLLYKEHGNCARLWDFKIKAMRKIQQEIERFKSDPPDKYSPSVLAVYDKQKYERALKVVGHTMLIYSFYGQWADVTREYKDLLPPKEREKWLSEIKSTFGCLPEFDSLDLGITAPKDSFVR